jgi:transcriptional regulator NrdR family protein
MKCPECRIQMFVTHSKQLKDGSISRTRTCPQCNKRYYTSEISKAEYQSLKVLSGDLRWAVDRYLKSHKRD